MKKLPLFYRDLTGFDVEAHGHIAFPDLQPDYRFAAATNIIPLLIHEVPLAIRHYPLVILPGTDEEPPALAVMVGIGNGLNRFVDGEGQWRPDTYVPAWVRRYPFFAARREGSEEIVLAIDPTADILAQTGGDPLVKKGQPTERLNRILAFNEEFQMFGERTVAITRALLESGVLEPATFNIRESDAEPKDSATISGFLLVSEQKLKSLSAEALIKLHEADALGLAYAQLFSIANLDKLLVSPPSVPKAVANPEKAPIETKAKRRKTGA